MYIHVWLVSLWGIQIWIQRAVEIFIEVIVSNAFQHASFAHVLMNTRIFFDAKVFWSNYSCLRLGIRSLANRAVRAYISVYLHTLKFSDEYTNCIMSVSCTLVSSIECFWINIYLNWPLHKTMPIFRRFNLQPQRNVEMGSSGSSEHNFHNVWVHVGFEAFQPWNHIIS